MTSSEDSSSCYVGKVNFDIDYQFVCDALNQTLINVRDFYVCEQKSIKIEYLWLHFSLIEFCLIKIPICNFCLSPFESFQLIGEFSF